MTKPLYGAKIPHTDFIELVSGMGADISTYNLSQWVKSKTKGEYVIIERAFIVAVIDFLELPANDHIFNTMNKQWPVDRIKDSLAW